MYSLHLQDKCGFMWLLKWRQYIRSTRRNTHLPHTQVTCWRSTDRKLPWKPQNVCSCLHVLKIFNYSHMYTLMLQVPASILSHNTWKLLEKTELPSVNYNIAIFNHKDSCDLGCGDVRRSQIVKCGFWGFCKNVLLYQWVIRSRYWGNVVASPASVVMSRSNFFVFEPLKMRQLHGLKMTGSNYPLTVCHIPEELNPCIIRCSLPVVCVF